MGSGGARGENGVADGDVGGSRSGWGAQGVDGSGVVGGFRERAVRERAFRGWLGGEAGARFAEDCDNPEGFWGAVRGVFFEKIVLQKCERISDNM